MQGRIGTDGAYRLRNDQVPVALDRCADQATSLSGNQRPPELGRLGGP